MRLAHQVTAMAVLLGVLDAREAIGQCRQQTFMRYAPNIEVADLNADGLPELIVGEGGVSGNGEADLGPATAQVYLVNRNRTRLRTPDGSMEAPPHWFRKEDGDWIDGGARFVDVDRDGYQDLVVAYRHG